MIYEYSASLDIMYIYNAENTAQDALDCLKKSSVKMENVGGFLVYIGSPALQKNKLEKAEEDLNRTVMNVKCCHGAFFSISTSKYFPREGWEELLDCWICCQSEKNVLLDKEVTITPGTVFASDFYFYVSNGSIPLCCQDKQDADRKLKKVFYNEIDWKLAPEYLVFRYFSHLFERKHNFLFEHNGTRYEVKYYYKTHLCKRLGNIFLMGEAIKVGVKKTNKVFYDKGHINSYFIDKIYQVLSKNTLGIDMCGYKLSFIPEHILKNA